jgi:hypothetical protein
MSDKKEEDKVNSKLFYAGEEDRKQPPRRTNLDDKMKPQAAKSVVDEHLLSREWDGNVELHLAQQDPPMKQSKEKVKPAPDNEEETLWYSFPDNIEIAPPMKQSKEKVKPVPDNGEENLWYLFPNNIEIAPPMSEDIDEINEDIERGLKRNDEELHERDGCTTNDSLQQEDHYKDDAKLAKKKHKHRHQQDKKHHHHGDKMRHHHHHHHHHHKHKQERQKHDEKSPSSDEARSSQVAMNVDGVIDNGHGGGRKLMGKDESKLKAAAGARHVEKNVNEPLVSPDTVGPQSTSRRCKKSLRRIQQFDVIDDTIEKPSKGFATYALDIQEQEGEWRLHGLMMHLSNIVSSNASSLGSWPFRQCLNTSHIVH